MKKALCLLLCSFITLSGFAQTASRDVVLLLDTSASMSDYYLEVRDYLSGPFLREFLRLGDTFHLVSFSDRTRLELSRRVDGQNDIETIVGRLLLMYPLDPYSDIVSALRFAERYITSLPGSHTKSLVFISDGDNNPAPSTRLESVNIQNLIAEIATRLNRSGVSFEFIPIPRGSRPRLSFPATPAQASAAQAPTTTRPATTPSLPGTQAPAATPSLPGTQAPAATPSLPGTQAPAATPSLPGTQAPAITPSVSDRQTSPITPSLPGTQTSPITPTVSDTQASPTTPTVSDTQASPASHPATTPTVPDTQAPPTPKKPSQPIKLPRITLPTLSIPADTLFFVVIGAGSLTLLAIVALALLTATRLHNSPNRMMGAVMEQALLSAENASDTTPPMLSLFVKDQPSTRGRQNMHILQAGHTLSIGGDPSDDFVISIVTVPRRIARVRFDGKHYTLIPQKPQSLPDIGTAPVQDCVGKEIRVVHKNFEVYLALELHENPLRTLNDFLHSVNTL